MSYPESDLNGQAGMNDLRPDEDIGRCPNCGSHAGMIAHAHHSFDQSTGEMFDDYWLTCVDCKARTTIEEMNR